MISVPFVLWGVCCLLWEGSHQTVLRRNCQALQPEWSHFSKMCNNLKLRLLDIILYGAYIWCTVLSTTLVSLNVSSQDIQKQLISLFSSSCPCCHSYPLPLSRITSHPFVTHPPLHNHKREVLSCSCHMGHDFINPLLSLSFLMCQRKKKKTWKKHR